MIKLVDIKLNTQNPRSIKEDKFKKLVKSIKESTKFLEARPIVIKDGVVYGGNMRLRALQELGYTEVPDEWVKDVSGWTAEDIHKFIVVDNVAYGDNDWDLLSEQYELEELLDWGMDIEHEDKWDTDEVEEDEAPPVEQGEAISQLGEVYQVGSGKLMCGDSTKVEDYAKLMGGVQADMVFTDPPYNVNYSGTGKNTSEVIMNDKMSAESFQEFLDDAFKQLDKNTKSGGAWYVCHSQKYASTFEKAIKNSGYEVKEQIIWVKPSATLGWQEYRRQHEPIFYCGKDKTTFYGDRTNTTVWQQKPNKKALTQWLQNQLSKDYDGVSTVWRIGRANVTEYVHTTEKPVALSARAIKNSSKQGDIILDIFAGSGSTMSACLQGDRVPYLMELDPHYCDVIRKRYAKFINKEAEWQIATPRI